MINYLWNTASKFFLDIFILGQSSTRSTIFCSWQSSSAPLLSSCLYHNGDQSFLSISSSNRKVLLASIELFCHSFQLFGPGTNLSSSSSHKTVKALWTIWLTADNLHHSQCCLSPEWKPVVKNLEENKKINTAVQFYF